VGRALLVWRLVAGDIKRRRVQSALLGLMIMTTTTTLTLGLVLHGVTDNPFARTRAATRGPDVSAVFFSGPGSGSGTRTAFAALRHAHGVVAASGPYPLAWADLADRGASLQVTAEGRDGPRSGVDEPLLTAGHWVQPGGAVIERGLAGALGVHVGRRIRLNGRSFEVVGIALTTARGFYPASTPGLVWLTRADANALASAGQPLDYALNLRLANPAAAPAFANRYSADTAWWLNPWQDVGHSDGRLVAVEQKALLIVSWLLAMVSIASIAVLIGGRMAEQTRRVGLLKAVGGTPALIAVVLLAENLLIAIAAAIVGLAAGQLLAPLLTNAGNGLLGTPAAPALTVTAAVLGVGVAVAVAAVATVFAAVRGARTSTIRALHDPPRPPQRRARLIALSARLPVPLLLGLRLAARRPKRTALAIAGVAIAVAMITATVTLRHNVVVHDTQTADATILSGTSTMAEVSHVVYILTAILAVVAAVNILFTTWTSVIDAQRPSALARALGATPRQISAALTTAQLLPALLGACLGIPLGVGLYMLAGGHAATAAPPISSLVAVIAGTLIVVAMLTAVPAQIGARRSVTEALAAE
jgi:putative ABC transport system permease protein